MEGFADPLTHQRRLALVRFARKLDDAAFPGAPWEGEPERRALITEAARFLTTADDAINASAAPDLLQRDTGGRGSLVSWYDAVLDLFARRVRGLGVRTGGMYDSDATDLRPDVLFEADE